MQNYTELASYGGRANNLIDSTIIYSDTAFLQADCNNNSILKMWYYSVNNEKMTMGSQIFTAQKERRHNASHEAREQHCSARNIQHLTPDINKTTWDWFIDAKQSPFLLPHPRKWMSVSLTWDSRLAPCFPFSRLSKLRSEAGDSANSSAELDSAVCHRTTVIKTKRNGFLLREMKVVRAASSVSYSLLRVESLCEVCASVLAEFCAVFTPYVDMTLAPELSVS